MLWFCFYPSKITLFTDFVLWFVFICSISPPCTACLKWVPCLSLFLSMQYAIFQSPIILNVSLSCCVCINLFSFLLFLHSLSQSSFLFCLPLAVGSPYFAVTLLLSNLSLLPFFPLLLFCLLTFFPPPPVSISPPGANPQLCGVLVLLPTWAERLFPPGPLLGANDRAVPGQCQPLPRTKPQQQVGRTRTEWNNDYETWWNLNTSWFQKFGLQSWLF